jgi:hypothetical protein
MFCSGGENDVKYLRQNVNECFSNVKIPEIIKFFDIHIKLSDIDREFHIYEYLHFKTVSRIIYKPISKAIIMIVPM